MPLFGGNDSGPMERTFRVWPKVAYWGLVAVAEKRFEIKDTDDFAMTIQFSSDASGEDFSAQVVPVDGGALIEVQKVGKVGAHARESARNRRLVKGLLSAVSARLRAAQHA